ncbi:Ti-type conjugative transfer relaxase TraA [Phenylobacterium soli]|uniref:Ti-type conjugative transfer relaxase TraA n=1 Tax=Phenylobacterium soli TaxID=2170551 RepID=A0A328AM11_9CAUL|nr:Ti-type conjugative transfer relaxase TraA [Phenylobacterium soli]RAK55900.1 Ti-type conjugative transfer relaxase TraA [Phenylobacterium soli]
MAIYHFSAKVISRANGSSAVAAAAYRSGSRLHDERLGRAHDFTNKAGVVHSEILAPDGVPERWRDRETLWNEVEAGERRRDAQLVREVEFAIPRELSQADGIQLARDFVKREFVDRGMVADLNVHWDVAADGTPKPHAHVMLSMRDVGPDGFGAKVRAWNRPELLMEWRSSWAEHANARLAALDIDAAIDHRSLKAQGIDLEPQNKIGAAASGRAARGELAERIAEHRAIARRNGELIAANPSLAFDAITRCQSTFTDYDLMRFAHRHTDDAAQFQRAVSALKTSPELVGLGKDAAGRERFSTRDMLRVEEALEASAARLADRGGHEVREWSSAGPGLGDEQSAAMAHVTTGADLALVVGYAGSGKTAMLGAAREAWAADGLTVRGAALSGIAAESLEAGSSIPSRTLASLEHSWANGRDLLRANDVLVVDEAGMIGSRQMARVVAAVEQAGAKLVLVGDVEQLQAIEAGAAFRALAERHGAAEITEVRRQAEGWQRHATRELATGRTSEALARYEAAGAVHDYATTADARAGLAAGWERARVSQPQASQLMLAHTRADVAELNRLARASLRSAGSLGEDQAVATERGERMFAAGDRIMFLRNEKSLGVKNGTLGRVERIERGDLVVRLDGTDRREVTFSISEYADIDHGYAATIHKAQGVTVDRVHVLATSGLDRHAAYVAMTRHRQAIAVHFGRDQFRDRVELTRTLSRERPKDTTLDYSAGFATRRGIRRADDLELRVAAFVKEWAALSLRMGRGAGRDVLERRALERDLRRLTDRVDRDPALGAALSARRADLGIGDSGRAQRRLVDDLIRSVGRNRGLDLGR